MIYDAAFQNQNVEYKAAVADESPNALSCQVRKNMLTCICIVPIPLRGLEREPGYLDTAGAITLAWLRLQRKF